MLLLSPNCHLHTGRDQLLSLLKPAEMNEYSRNDCLPTTRLDVIKSIIEWITDESSERKSVLWLYGVAGSGKSTISTTVAWMMRELHRLGAFFFFDRDIPERNAAMLIRTVAYHLALLDTRISDAISRIVENYPRIAEMPLDFQITNLLSAKALESVHWSGGPIVLVIDAFDELTGNNQRKELLQALSKGFHRLPPFIRVMVISRQEPDIQHALGSHSAVCRYPLGIDSAINEDDIRKFIQHRLDQIRMEKQHLSLDCNWPGDDNISGLTRSAGGLFVWASTACLYIDGYDPDRRLRELIAHPSETNFSEPFAQLDKLYKTALQSAGYWNDSSFCADCRDILGVILCSRTPLSHSVIDALLELPPSRTCLQSISRLGCVLRTDESEGVRLLHPSFHDYLSERCSVEPWSINLQLQNNKLAVHCIELLDRMLCENICGLTLENLVNVKLLPSALPYACKFWIEHVCFISNGMNDILDRIYQFLCRHLLHWMEVLAILKCHDLAIQSLVNLLEWIQVCFPVFLRRAETHIFA
jgi:hypothetical protein